MLSSVWTTLMAYWNVLFFREFACSFLLAVPWSNEIGSVLTEVLCVWGWLMWIDDPRADCYLRDFSRSLSVYSTITSGPVLFCDWSVSFLFLSHFMVFSRLLRFLTTLFLEDRCFPVVLLVTKLSCLSWLCLELAGPSAWTCLDF